MKYAFIYSVDKYIEGIIKATVEMKLPTEINNQVIHRSEKNNKLNIDIDGSMDDDFVFIASIDNK